MPTSTPSRPPEATQFLPPEAAREALGSHGAEVLSLALSEMAANPALPRLVALLGPENLGRAFVTSPLDLSQALAELGGELFPQLERLHLLSVRPHLMGKIFARSLPSFMKGMHEIARRDITRSLREFAALLPGNAPPGLPRPFPEARSEAHTLLALLERLAGKPAGPPPPGELPVGCEVEVPRLAGYPAGGAYVFALFAGLPLGEDELIEFSLPPAPGAALEVRLIGALLALGLLPSDQVLSLHVTCETPEEASASPELAPGMRLVSFSLAYLYSADRRLASGQIFKNFRLKRGISGLKWPRAFGVEYRLANVCTAAAGEPGVLGDPLRAHEATLLLAERLHEALLACCLGRPGPWPELRGRLGSWLETCGLEELALRELNVTGELAGLFARRRTPQRQRELLNIVREFFEGLPAAGAEDTPAHA